MAKKLEYDLAKFYATCQCGMTFDIIAPVAVVANIREIWSRQHQGPGHGPRQIKHEDTKNTKQHDIQSTAACGLTSLAR